MATRIIARLVRGRLYCQTAGAIFSPFAQSAWIADAHPVGFARAERRPMQGGVA